jgi:flagellar assembly protein FliH
MRSSEPRPFVPLGGAAEATFRPLGAPAPVTDAPSPVHDAAGAAYEAGRAAGLAEARAEHALLGCEIDSLLAALHAWRAEVRSRYTPLAVSLAVEVARQIVGDALEVRPERWTAIVAGALGRLLARERVTARMSPHLAAIVRAHAPGLAEAGVRIVEDATLAPDGCRIESDAGERGPAVGAEIAALAQALGATP